MRLKLLPQSYIYPKEPRSVRDMLRRRMLFVEQRTSMILSLQSMINRHRGLNFTGNEVKTIRDDFVDTLFDDEDLRFTAKRELMAIRHLDQIVKEIEVRVSSRIKLKKEYQMLLT